MTISSTPITLAPLAPYRVLARKYRPQTLSALVGQDVLVKTLSQAIAANRLPHAFVLHGIRGVGKTTTARIIAKALNCEGADGTLTTPVADPCGVCESCLSIAQDRHMDVVEMDAASRTSVDDIREIIDTARYKAVNGRYKIYIIDEVHMLSKSAFNALLKTLEEPPPHVKFIFATTELKKIPDTVLSRCMRFDLARVTPSTLFTYFTTQILPKEAVTFEEEGVALIVRAADGSVRDGLSLLDQGIALGDGQLTTAHVREMLGVTDRGGLFSLLTVLLEGQADAVLSATRQTLNQGGDPLHLLQDLLDLVYWVSCLKAAPKLQSDIVFPESDRREGMILANKVPMASLSRAWQVLSKGLTEVANAPFPAQTLDMVLIRLCYLSQMPSAEDLLAALSGEQRITPQIAQEATTTPSSTALAASGAEKKITAALPETFKALVSFMEVEPRLYVHLMQDVYLISYAPGNLVMQLAPEAPHDFVTRLGAALEARTGVVWSIIVEPHGGSKTLMQTQKEEAATFLEEARNHPLVKRLTDMYPESKVTVKLES